MIFDAVINWFNDLKNGMELARASRLYRQRQDYQLNLIQRSQERTEMWSSPLTQYQGYDSQEQPARSYNTTYREHDTDDSRLGIAKKIESCHKSIVMWTRWDNFYISVRHDDEGYRHFIYLGPDGLSKHDWRVEIEGVDLV